MEVEGTELRALPEPEAGKPAKVVRLLPAFDQWVVGATRQIEQFVPAGVERQQIYRPQGWLTPVLLVSGRVAGLWRHERKGKRIEVSISRWRSCPPGPGRGPRRRPKVWLPYLGGEISLSWQDA